MTPFVKYQRSWRLKVAIMRPLQRILILSAMVITLSALPALSTLGGASPAPGIVDGITNHCPGTSDYKGQVTVSVHYASGELAVSTSTVPKSSLTHFRFYTPPGNYFVVVKSDVTIRWPYRVRYFHVSSGTIVQLPEFKNACESAH
jgi:hypothetical protein